MAALMRSLQQKTKGKWCIKAALAEFIAMTLFVYIGCGTAMFLSAPPEFDASVIQSLGGATLAGRSFGISTALAFGFTITFLVYSIGHISGGHINSSVSWAMFLSGKISVMQLIVNTIAQFLGSILGAAFLLGSFPMRDSSLGANAVAAGASAGNALLGEIFMTFTLVFVILMTTSQKAASGVGHMAPVAIGLAVFAAHAVLLPLDGCSINPSRSFGPALLSGRWKDFWVFVVGPYLGSTIAAVSFRFLPGLLFHEEPETDVEQAPISNSTSIDTLNTLDSIALEQVEASA